MEQRQVRLGDVLDDYCPRERRVTNHAVVAIVGDQIKLTRCTTCDNEHPYKSARVPPRRQTKLVAALSRTEPTGATLALQTAAPAAAGEPAPSGDPTPESAPPSPTGARSSQVDSVRRPLIRATLERPEGTPPPVRQPPVFTIRENGRDYPFDRNGKPQQRRRRNGGRPSGDVDGNRMEGHQGQSSRPGQGKNGARGQRPRSTGNRTERPHRGHRSRGKGRSR